MKCGMIFLAGGIGKRMNNPTPKQMLLLAGKPIMMHVLEKIEEVDKIDKVVITCPEDHIDGIRKMISNHNIKKEIECVKGGETRQDSVYNGMMALKGYDTVIIHEAVRPFVSADEFKALVDCEYENAFYGVDIPFTVLEGSSVVTGILERDKLVNVQLPQKFNYDKLLDAHEKARAEGKQFTEDASMFYCYEDDKVKILQGTHHNIKITNPVDLIVGENIYKEYFLRRN